MRLPHTLLFSVAILVECHFPDGFSILLIRCPLYCLSSWENKMKDSYLPRCSDGPHNQVNHWQMFVISSNIFPTPPPFGFKCWMHNLDHFWSTFQLFLVAEGGFLVPCFFRLLSHRLKLAEADFLTTINSSPQQLPRQVFVRFRLPLGPLPS